jgi:hypothetical protein
MSLTHKTKVHIVVSIVLLVASGLVAVVGWSYLTKMGERLEDRVAAVSTYLEREQKYDDLLDLVNATTAEREELSGYLLRRDEAPDFVTRGEQIAAEQGVEYTTDSLKEIENENDYDELVAVFSMKGQEENVRHMIQVLEATPYHSQVMSLKMDRSDTAQTGEVEATVRLVVTLLDI